MADEANGSKISDFGGQKMEGWLCWQSAANQPLASFLLFREKTGNFAKLTFLRRSQSHFIVRLLYG